MDMQKFIDALGESARLSRTNYHLTLGGLIHALEAAPQDAKVLFSDGSGLGPEHSYRGYYSDLSFSPGEVATVADALTRARRALDSTYDGYKGGDFTMREDTPLWAAPWGCCGPAIIGASLIEGVVILELKDVEP